MSEYRTHTFICTQRGAHPPHKTLQVTPLFHFVLLDGTNHSPTIRVTDFSWTKFFLGKQFPPFLQRLGSSHVGKQKSLFHKSPTWERSGQVYR